MKTTEAQTLATPDIDETDGPKKVPNRSNRYRLFDDGHGDYRVYQLFTGSSSIPKGALLPIAGCPGFASTAEAKKWIRQSAEKLNGMQLMILRGMEIMKVELVNRPTVNLESKPRTKITGA